MKGYNSHPGRSAEFLSRLHDGELTAAERAHFESHRAHCVECRHAAAEFEAALSLYRSTGSAPPAPDLAARILRKLQASGPRRRPFGVFYGIDLKWAGAFAAALLAAIIGSAIVLRHEVPLPSSAKEAAIPVLLEQEGAQQRPQQAAPTFSAGDSLRASAPTRRKAGSTQAPPAAPAATKDLRPAVAPSNASVEESRQVAAAEAKPKTALSSEVRVSKLSTVDVPRTAEPSGGDGAAAGSMVSSERPPTHLVILPADGRSSVPALLPGGSLEPLAAERGREFLLIVATQGRVRDVRPVRPQKSLRAPESPAEAPSSALRVLLALRFEPSDRPRRLLVRVE